MKEQEAALHKAILEIERAVPWVPAIQPHTDELVRKKLTEHASIVAMLGSACKRKAQALNFQARKLEQNGTPKDGGDSKLDLALRERIAEYNQQSDEAVREAISFYRRAFELDARCHWAAVQRLGLSAYLRRKGRLRAADSEAPPFEIAACLWEAAWMAAQEDLRVEDSSKQAWACGSLSELYFLAPALPENTRRITEEDSRKFGPDPDSGVLALGYARRLVAIAGPKAFETESTYWQFNRYAKWLKLGESFESLAREIVTILKPI